MLSGLAGLIVHYLHGNDNQGSWSGKDSIAKASRGRGSHATSCTDSCGFDRIFTQM